MDQEISKFILKLRRAHPFLGSMALFAEYAFTKDIKFFDTNGRTIRINPDYYASCTAEYKIGMLLHLLLHCALLHAVRRQNREHRCWNIAADIAVNNIILEDRTFPPPLETVVDESFINLSTEQIYERLLEERVSNKNEGHNPKSKDTNCTQPKAESNNVDHKGQPYHADLKESTRVDQTNHNCRIELHWKSAHRRAKMIDSFRSQRYSDLPAGIRREIDIAYTPVVDWRTVLWRHVVKTPCDFSNFDRRFVYQNLYLEELCGDSLKVDFVVDTSGSISRQDLTQFITEVEAITRTYEHIEAQLYYVDAEVHGPFAISRFDTIPT